MNEYSLASTHDSPCWRLLYLNNYSEDILEHSEAREIVLLTEPVEYR